MSARKQNLTLKKLSTRRPLKKAKPVVSTKEKISSQKVKFNAEVTNIQEEKVIATPAAETSKVESPVVDEAKLQAEALFRNMKAEAEVDGSNVLEHEDPDLSVVNHEVDDLAKAHYNKQIEILKTEKLEHAQEMKEEIQQLKDLLEATRLQAVEEINEAKRPISKERQDPIVQNVTLNGIKSKLLVCNFFPQKGRIGISFKRYGNQFFVVDITKGTQVDEYKGIGPGLLLYQCISAVPGQGEGTNISVVHSEELARTILAEFGKGKQIQMSFLVLPENIPIQNIHQHVLKNTMRRMQPSRARYY